MDFLFKFFPDLPWSPLLILMNMIAMTGVTLHIYGVLLEKEKNRDIVFVIGGLALFIYSVWINSKIFMVAMGGFTIASAIELFEIVSGRHKHSPQDIKNYENTK